MRTLKKPFQSFVNYSPSVLPLIDVGISHSTTLHLHLRIVLKRQVQWLTLRKPFYCNVCPTHHSSRVSSLTNLGMLPQTRFRKTGSTMTLEEAILMHCESFPPSPPPFRLESLDLLASAL